MARIAFIGLGNMGGGMAANLVNAGHQVRAVDLSTEATERAKGQGCEIVPTAREAVQGVDAVVSMLPNGKIVGNVYTSDVIGQAPSSALLLDCSTIDVATARKVGDAATAAGYEMVDAPVSGGIAAANAGTLTFMVGGTDAAFAKAESILSAMGKAVIPAGARGAGQAVKICNNMLLGASMIATCETFKLTERLGLDLQTFFDIAFKVSGQNWSMTSYCPVPGVGPQSPADNDYQGGFAAALMLNDLRLAMEAAWNTNASVPLGEKAEEITVPSLRLAEENLISFLLSKICSDRTNYFVSWGTSYPGVERGGRQLGVTKQDLDDADVDAVLEQMGGEAVSQRVRADSPSDPGSVGSLGRDPMDLPVADRLEVMQAGEQPSVGMHHALSPTDLPPFAQQQKQVMREHRVAVTAAFAAYDPERSLSTSLILSFVTSDARRPAP
jgi:3-hydroxyisobutyrate dehydrogenase